MIAEFAIIPDVFDQASYSSPELAESRLGHLADACVEDVIVRDLRDGEWSEHLQRHKDRWPPGTKKIIETLGKENRLRLSPKEHSNSAEQHEEWYYEAAASHKKSPLDLILVGDASKPEWKDAELIVPIAKLRESGWWQNRRPSIPVRCNTSDYLNNLRPTLTRSKSFMFIDPHIDERKSNYAEFHKIIQEIKQPDRIEIHFHRKDDRSRRDWEDRVRFTSAQLKKARRKALVFVWEDKDVHDRYLITDFVGISLPGGFDISPSNPQAKTKWTRLGREDRLDVEREFDRNSDQHVLNPATPFPIGYEGCFQ